LSLTQLDALYDYYERWLVPCLAAHGGGVVEIPSREEFVDGGDGAPGWWNPYLESTRPASMTGVIAQFAECRRTCQLGRLLPHEPQSAADFRPDGPVSQLVLGSCAKHRCIPRPIATA